MEKPRRRFVATLEVGADTIEDLAMVFRNLAYDACRGQMPTTSVSGGYGAGYIWTMTENPEQTHDLYFEQNDAYLAWLKEEEALTGRGAG